MKIEIESYNKIIQLIDGKLEVISKIVPSNKFYKYYSLNENSLGNLKGNTLHFSHPYTLNDIMDGNFQLLDLYDFVEQYKKDVNRPDLPHDDLIKLFYNKLSEPFLKSFGVLSLATTFNNDLFWPHYTSEEGFCIEFDSDTLIKSLPKENFYSFPITYEVLKPINFNDYIVRKQIVVDKKNKVDVDARIPIIYSLSHKDKIWEYENEWRFLLKSESFEKVSHKLKIIDDELFEEEKYKKKTRNIPYERSSIEKIILSTLFFNNTRFNSVVEGVDVLNYSFKKCKDNVLFDFFKLLLDNYNDCIYQLDKIYNKDSIERRLNFKIEIIELTEDYLKLKKTKLQ